MIALLADLIVRRVFPPPEPSPEQRQPVRTSIPEAPVAVPLPDSVLPGDRSPPPLLHRQEALLVLLTEIACRRLDHKEEADEHDQD